MRVPQFNAKSLLDHFHFVQNDASVTPQKDPEEIPALIYLLARPDPDDVPRNWEFIDYKLNEIEVACYRAHTHGEPKSKITLFSGFKAEMDTYDTPQVRMLQRLGIELDIVLLPDPGPQIGYLHDNKDIVRQALTESPPPGGIKPGIPNFIFGHSLGGRAIIANMMDDEFAEHVKENYAGGVLIAPHFSSPYRSKPILNAIYTSYCKLFSKKSYGEAPLDWMLSATERFKDMIKSGGSAQSPREDFEEKTKVTHSPITTQNTATTHGQILYSNREGEKLWDDIQKFGVPEAAREFPMVMLGGSKDFVSSKNHIKSVAEAFDAEFYEFDTYHHPFLESKAARALILKSMQDMTEGWTNMPVPSTEILRLEHRDIEAPEDQGINDLRT